MDHAWPARRERLVALGALPAPKPRSGRDLTGVRSGRLVGVRILPERNKWGSVMWLCRCDCGAETAVSSVRLNKGQIRSCGCLRRENGKERKGKPNLDSFRHGLIRHPLYKTWAGMKNRCGNESEPSYRYYGKRGIRVCEEWQDDPAAFITWAIMNGWTESNRWTVDRIDSDGHYDPRNCQMLSRSDNSAKASRLMWARGRDRFSMERGRASYRQFLELQKRQP